MTQSTSARAIVVGHDGSPSAGHAVRAGARYAELFHAPLIVVRARRTDGDIRGYALVMPDDQAPPQAADAVRSSLADECDAILQNYPHVQAHYRVESGAPPDILCRVSNTARVLVLGSRGLGGLTGLLLGSVTARCLHQASCPVLIIREPSAEPAPPAHSAEEERVLERLRPSSVIVGHDGSTHSAHATQIAAEFAEALGASITVIRCWSIDTMPHGLLWKDGSVVPLAEASNAIRTQLEGDIAEIAMRHPTVEFHCEGVFGEPEGTLVRLSRGASLLVTGSRGRGGFRRLLLGSVASYCAHRAMCPTLVVPDDRARRSSAATVPA